MSKKQVSIRLFIEGGKVVRGEFKDIGNEAERTGRRVGKGMSEGERALASFMSKAKIVAAAGAAAMSGLGAMVIDRGLEMIDVNAKLAQSLDTTVASIQVMERAGELAGVSMSGVEQATKDMHRRLSQAATGTGPAIDALNRLGLSADALMKMPLDERIAAISDAMEKFIPEAEKAAVAGQIFGEEGSIAMGRLDTEKLKRAREELEKYGLLISDVDAAGVERANDALSKLSTIWIGMGNSLAAKVAPTLERVANMLAESLGPDGTVGRAISFLGENIERTFAYAASFAAFMGGKWVFSMARAALSVKGVSTALVLLKGSLISTGIGALIVGAGELALIFTRLVQGAGGVGNAMTLMGDVARAVLNEMQIHLDALPYFAEASAWALAGAFISAFRWISEKFDALVNHMTTGPYNKIADALGLEKIDPIEGIQTKGLKLAEDALFGQALDAYHTGVTISSAAIESRRALELLKDAIKAAGEDGEVTIDESTASVQAYEAALAVAAGNTQKAGDKLFKGWEAVTEKLKDYVKGATDWGNNLGDVFVRAFGRAESAFETFLNGGKVNMKDFVRSLLADLAMLSFRQNIMAPVAKWLGIALGGGAGSGLLAAVEHGGGSVGFSGSSRRVPSGVFAGAPRMHNGGWAGLRPDEVPTILQRGERVLSRREVASGVGAGNGIVGVRIFLDENTNLRAAIEGVAGSVAAEVVDGHLEAYDSEVLPRRVEQIGRNPGMIG